MSKKKDNWIGKATAEMKKKGTVGLFTKKAKAKGMTAQEYADEILENPKGKSLKLRREAQFAHEMGEIAKDRRKRKYKKGGKTQGYNDKLDESLAKRTGTRKSKSQSYKARRDESKAANKMLGRRAYQSVGTMDNEDWEKGWKMGKGGIIDEGDMVKIKDTGKTMKVKDISVNSKKQVEFSGDDGTFLIGDIKKVMKKGGKTQGYDDRENESLGMRTGKQSSKKVSAKGRRDDSYGKWGKRDEEKRKVSMKHGGMSLSADRRYRDYMKKTKGSMYEKGGETKKKSDNNETMLLGGIAGILLGAFLGRK